MLDKLKTSIKSITAKLVDTLPESSILSKQEDEFCRGITAKMDRYEQTIKEKDTVINNQQIEFIKLYSELNHTTGMLVSSEETVNTLLKTNIEIARHNKILITINIVLSISIISYAVLEIIYN